MANEPRTLWKILDDIKTAQAIPRNKDKDYEINNNTRKTIIVFVYNETEIAFEKLNNIIIDKDYEQGILKMLLSLNEQINNYKIQFNNEKDINDLVVVCKFIEKLMDECINFKNIITPRNNDLDKIKIKITGKTGEYNISNVIVFILNSLDKCLELYNNYFNFVYKQLKNERILSSLSSYYYNCFHKLIEISNNNTTNSNIFTKINSYLIEQTPINFFFYLKNKNKLSKEDKNKRITNLLNTNLAYYIYNRNKTKIKEVIDQKFVIAYFLNDYNKYENNFNKLIKISYYISSNLNSYKNNINPNKNKIKQIYIFIYYCVLLIYIIVIIINIDKKQILEITVTNNKDIKEKLDRINKSFFDEIYNMENNPLMELITEKIVDSNDIKIIDDLCDKNEDNFIFKRLLKLDLIPYYERNKYINILINLLKTNKPTIKGGTKKKKRRQNKNPTKKRRSTHYSIQ
jgi:hypothetical protein